MAQPGLYSTAMAVSTKAKNKGKNRKRKKSTMAGGVCATVLLPVTMRSRRDLSHSGSSKEETRLLAGEAQN